VVGSGVTGAEFASAYQSLGSQVTLVSSRERVLPHEDVDAAVVIEEVFRRRGMTVLGRSRAAAAKRHGDRVVVTLTDGRVVRGSHCLLTVGMEPSIAGLGCEDAGVKLDDRGFVTVDRVSRTSTPGVYARVTDRRAEGPTGRDPGPCARVSARYHGEYRSQGLAWVSAGSPPGPTQCAGWPRSGSSGTGSPCWRRRETRMLSA
jgi:thioredoxin reductase